KFLDDLRDNAFSETNKEDMVKHIKYFLKIVDPVNLPNVNHERIRLAVSPISLVGNASKWFDEFKGSITTWVDLTEFFLENITRLLVLVDNNEGVIDEGFSDIEEANNDDDEQETAEIFRIKTNLFDYKTQLCTEFKEFNYLLKVDLELFIHDIERTKSYEDYENELNDELEEPWSEDGVPCEICDHICEPFHFKDGKATWPTCSSNDDGFYNGRKLSGMVRVGYMTYFQDYEWYDKLMDGNLKEEALKQKAVYESHGVMLLQDYWWKVNNQEYSPFSNWRDHIRGPYANFTTTYDPYLDVNRIFGRNGKACNNCNVQEKEEQHNERRGDTAHNAPVCKIRRFEMIKYSFGKKEEYVAIKECEYDDLTRTNKDACRAY
ncbi:hypothetical protein Tco_0558452, partial [Tanacetum coccineum]